MAIVLRSGIERLVLKVREYLETNGVTAIVGVGKRALHAQVNQGLGRANRIVFLPFDPKSGAAGSLAEPEQAGKREIMDTSDPPVRIATVRALVDWNRDMLVSVWAYDGNQPEDDLAQEAALEQLFEWTVRAVHWTGFASVVFSRVETVVQGERPFGRELRVALSLNQPLYDVPKDIGFPALEIERSQG